MDVGFRIRNIRLDFETIRLRLGIQDHLLCCVCPSVVDACSRFFGEEVALRMKNIKLDLGTDPVLDPGYFSTFHDPSLRDRAF